MRPSLRTPLLLLLSLLLVLPAAAQERYGDDRYGYDRYDDYEDDVRQAVARVSYFEGTVSFNRGDDPDGWQLASLNYPMTLGDRIWAARDARVELQLRGATVYLGPETELAALDLTYDVRQLALAIGTATFRVHRLERGEVFEVATPNVSVTFDTPGEFRVDVDDYGNSQVSVRRGRAWAAAAGGEVGLERGERMRVYGYDRPEYDLVGLARTDGWDRWVERRARAYRYVRSTSYVHPDVYGVEDLDGYGYWESHGEYGMVWYPRVSSGWEPYRYGRWVWIDPWGWTWVSSEPWGWAPYHYGRWTLVRGRWCWVPVGPRGRYPGWAPAVVGFVGSGPGWSVTVSSGGFVGWFPLGPLDPFLPWWLRSDRRSPRGSDHSYTYRSRATVVQSDLFVRGGRVDTGFVRDARIVREVSAAPVARGPLPVLPTRDSIRVTLEGPARNVVRPPEEVRQREVVTRIAPPPPPATFERKIEVIREQGGAPVQVDVSRRPAFRERGETPSVQPVRPATRQEVQLVPRGEVGSSRQPRALAPSTIERGDSVDRPVPRRDEQVPVPEPEPRRQEVSPRPTAAPRSVDVPEPRAPREPAPQPESWRAPTPTRVVVEPRPVRRDPAPRVETTEPKPVQAQPVQAQPMQPKPVQAQPVQPQPAQPQPVQARPVKAKPVKAEPKEAEPTKPAPKTNEVPPGR